MCGRVIIKLDDSYWQFCEALANNEIGYEQIDWFAKHIEETRTFYPTDMLPVIIQSNNKPKVTPMYWNLLPHWAQSDAIFYETKTGRKVFKWKSTPRAHFNMRSDTIVNSNKWTELSNSHRCLIAVSNYIEWQDKDMLPPKQKPIGKKFAVKDSDYFYLAGIWDKITQENNDFYSVAVITTSPNKIMTTLPHHRMPVIIPEQEKTNWLSGKKDIYFKPFDENLMTEELYLEK